MGMTRKERRMWEKMLKRGGREDGPFIWFEEFSAAAPPVTGFRRVFSCASARWWLVSVLAATLALAAGVMVFSPLQPEVFPYKLVQAPLGGLAGFLLDRCLFPYAGPASYLRDDWRKNPNADGGHESPDFPVLLKHQPAFCTAMIRQALLVVGGMLAVSMGL